MKKKLPALLLCLLLPLLLGSCSLDFSELADDGAFSYAYGNKTAFVTEYRWDGTEAGRTVRIPAQWNGKKIVSVGGYFGRGLPMPFTVDVSAYFPQDAQFADGVSPENAEETAALDFTLLLPAGLSAEDVKAERSAWVVWEDGKTVACTVGITVLCAD